MATGGTSSAAPSRQTKKLQEDLQGLEKDPLPFLQDLELSVEDNVNQLTGVMIGPENSDYAGGHFRFKIVFPSEYPFKFPEFYFVTNIRHPNVSLKDNVACHDQLMATWSPRIKLRDYLTEMHSLLIKTNYDSPIEGEPLGEKTRENARLWTQKYALPSNK